MGFCSERIAVNHFHKTLSSCDNLDHFNVCHLKRPFTLLLDAIKDSNWVFLFLYVING
jgi:hypothetical protein